MANSFKSIIDKYNLICKTQLRCADCPMTKESSYTCKTYMTIKPVEFEASVIKIHKELFEKDKKEKKSFFSKLFNKE